MSIEHLRDLAHADLPTHPYPLCLNRELRLDMVALAQQIEAAQREADRIANGQPPAGSLTDEDPAAKAERLTAELGQLYEDAKPDSIVLIFRRLPTARDVAEDGETAYSTIERRHTNNKTGAVDRRAVSEDLLPECYERAEDANGDDVGLSWLEVKRTLSAGDLARLHDFIFGVHHARADIPFDPRTSGLPETT